METEKIYVNKDFEGIIVCPQCEKRKRTNLSAYKARGNKALKVTCACGTHFQISVDFRRSYRKKTDFGGCYTRLSYKKDKGEIQILNLSAHGIGFRTATKSALSIGDQVRLEFTLDDQKQSSIEKDGIVRYVDGDYVGCEFTDLTQHERTLGFYLIP
jgi:hypothetical protein